MASTFGKQITLTLMGESHGEMVGVVISGFPAGLKINEALIRAELDRRKPGQNLWSTARKEGDLPQFLTGVYQHRTTGTPITIVFKNQDKRSQDYKGLNAHFRPAHADFTGQARYDGFNDPRGGGHFSGRLTVGMVIAGALAKQWLKLTGIEIHGHLSQVGNVLDLKLEEAMRMNHGIQTDFPMFSVDACEAAKEEIEQARLTLDSIGAEAEIVVTGMPVGIGSPIFDTVEGHIAKALFGVPAVKGISFGTGFDLVRLKGSEANDCFVMTPEGLRLSSNHNGGINGGISNGEAIVVKAAIKPTASIAKAQYTYDGTGMSWLEIKGRHDPCIGPRALPVIEAMVAFAIMDMLVAHMGINECQRIAQLDHEPSEMNRE